MRIACLLAASVLLLLFLLLGPAALAGEDGWTPLFDGKSLSGWRTLGGGPIAGWVAEDGEIRCVPSEGGGTSDIYTEREYQDFILELEYSIPKSGNSGVKYRMAWYGQQYLGPEFQILSESVAAGSDPKRYKGLTGALYDLIPFDPEARKPRPDGEWNSVRIVARGSTVEHWLNGRKLLEVDVGSEEFKEALAASKFRRWADFAAPRPGRIMLQYHGSRVSFRHIRIRELPVRLFDGKSLSGWKHFLEKPDVAMDDVWTVRDGILICKGEPLGYLRTEREFTSFRLAVEWRWAPGTEPGNSGVLLRINGDPKPIPRCIETQLKSGDAGDLYGFWGMKIRGDAERILAQAGHPLVGDLVGVSKVRRNENEPGAWNLVEIVADGAKIAVRLNGEKVNEATECDVIAGPIGLQSEGGEIHFRRVELTPLP